MLKKSTLCALAGSMVGFASILAATDCAQAIAVPTLELSPSDVGDRATIADAPPSQQTTAVAPAESLDSDAAVLEPLDVGIAAPTSFDWHFPILTTPDLDFFRVAQPNLTDRPTTLSDAATTSELLHSLAIAASASLSTDTALPVQSRSAAASAAIRHAATESLNASKPDDSGTFPESVAAPVVANLPATTLEEAPWLQAAISPTVEFSNTLAAAEQSDRLLPPPSETDAVTPIEFSPRVGVSYNSSGGGYDGFTRLDGFLPLKVSDRSLAFLEGNLRLNSDSHEGMTALLGYRHFDAERDRVWGGYIAYDNQAADSSFFHQLGLGIESLGNINFRANGYIPLGQSRNLLGTNTVQTGTQLSSLYFRKNFLLYDALNTFEKTNFYEIPLGGFDAELGGRLISFGEERDLRAYGGIYHYYGEGISSAWGWRARLEARPTDHLNMGVTLQQDGLLGTNLMFTVGFTFPDNGSSPKRRDNETHLPRLAESVQRQPTIAVMTDTETETFTETEIEIVARNPETEEPWFFQHVTLGARGGDGTFENPFGTVQSALSASQSDGNHIAYVDIGDNVDIQGFRIPDRVQVLSRGPVQPLDTTQFGTIQIPLSGTGQYPTIRGTTVAAGSLTGMVALGNDSTLSGFAIQANGNNGIVGNNVLDAIVRDNQISDVAQGIHIRGDGSTSRATILRNSVSDATQTAIFFDALNSGSIANTAISDNLVSNAFVDGIKLDIRSNSTLSNVIIADNTIQDLVKGGSSNAFADGIDISISEGSSANDIVISGNIIETVPDDGINIGIRHVPYFGYGISNVVVSDNSISNTGFNSYACGAGVEIFNNGSNSQVLAGISIANNIFQNAQDGSVLIDSTNVSFPRPDRTGIFRLRDFAGNTSSNPGNGVDLGFLLGRINGASVEFSGLGTVFASQPINPAISDAIQGNNNNFANIAISGSTNRNGRCPIP